MRKNKTSLTAHHFLSAPSDSLSHSFPIELFVSQGHHQNASLRLLRPVFFFPLWPVTDSSVQSINLSLPQSGPNALQGHVWTEHTHKTTHIPESVTLNGINIWRWREWENNEGQINLPSDCRTLIPCHRITSAKPSKWNSSAAFEYKECNVWVGLEHSGWEHLVRNIWAIGLKAAGLSYASVKKFHLLSKGLHQFMHIRTSRASWAIERSTHCWAEMFNQINILTWWYQKMLE